MGVKERRKGACGERELRRLLVDALGIDVTRNLAQDHRGGCDLLGVGPWAIEVKRQERLALSQWWYQACHQAVDAIPALAYRQSRRPWQIQIPLEYLLNRDCLQDWYSRPTATVDLEAFCLLTREIIAEEENDAA